MYNPFRDDEQKTLRLLTLDAAYLHSGSDRRQELYDRYIEATETT